jgi:hypothetical protein
VSEDAGSYQVAGNHYKQGVEPWDVVDSWGRDAREGYYLGNAIKYLLRYGKKDDKAQELKKAKHYIEKLIEVLEEA